jgi:rfaE bifunctional protein nucleotidyltransferase chain/domain
MGRVVAAQELTGILSDLRRQKKKIVFTNGCFDIIHRGHIDYLTKSRAMGDVLIVGVNSDASVRRIKGDNRPIVEEGDRAYIVANLSPVDFVCLFAEETPYQLISQVVPDVLVKGADWDVQEIVGRDIVERAGGTVATIDVVPDRSTTNIIQRIVERCA